MKILYVVGEGIGNQIQALPGLIYAQKKYEEVVVVNTIPHTSWVTKYILGNYAEVLEGEYIKGEECGIITGWDNIDGQLLTCSCWDMPIHNLPVLNAIKRKRNLKCSEVEYNLAIVDNKYTDNDFIVNFGYEWGQFPDSPDILIHNGYSKISDYAQERWKAKSYLYYEQLAKELKKQDYTVGSVGAKEEYVKGTIDWTQSSIMHTQALIEHTKLLIANDTGTYHLANLVNTPNIALFTFTDWRKSYDDRFHRQARIISAEYECQPCQFKDAYKDYWMENQEQCQWMCRNINIDVILKAVKEILG